jgi:hypothetical protein
MNKRRKMKFFERKKKIRIEFDDLEAMQKFIHATDDRTAKLSYALYGGGYGGFGNTYTTSQIEMRVNQQTIEFIFRSKDKEIRRETVPIEVIFNYRLFAPMMAGIARDVK